VNSTKVLILTLMVELSLLAPADIQAQRPRLRIASFMAGLAVPAQADAIYEIGHGVTPPKGVYMPDAEYSEKARKKKISGTVLLAMVVLADGTVRDVTVTQSLEPSLDQQAIEAVKRWKFQPATKDGKPVAVHVKAEVSFRIR